MVDSKCGTGSEALEKYFSKFSVNSGVFPNSVEQNAEKYKSAAEVLEKLFADSANDSFRFSPPNDNSSSAGGAVVRSFNGSMASFDVDTPESMELLRKFLKNVDDFLVSAVVDRDNPSKVLLMLDWRVEDVRR